MATPTLITSRRAMLGAIAVAPILALPAGAAVAPRRDWDAAVARHRAACVEHEAACTAYSKAEQAYLDARPIPPLGMVFEKGDTVEAFNRRVQEERETRERQDAECRRRFDVDAAEDREASTCNAAADLLDALLAMPAPDLAAVATKIELADEFGRETWELRPVLDDLRRLGSH